MRRLLVIIPLTRLPPLLPLPGLALLLIIRRRERFVTFHLMLETIGAQSGVFLGIVRLAYVLGALGLLNALRLWGLQHGACEWIDLRHCTTRAAKRRRRSAKHRS